MSAIGAGGSKFAKFMPNHILSYVHRYKLVAIVNRNRMANKVRSYC